jgi:hypothetical protein
LTPPLLSHSGLTDSLSLSLFLSLSQVCTVLAVFRGIGLVKERKHNVSSSEKRVKKFASELEWSEEQQVFLAHIHEHLLTYETLVKKKAELEDEYRLLLQKKALLDSGH